MPCLRAKVLTQPQLKRRQLRVHVYQHRGDGGLFVFSRWKRNNAFLRSLPFEPSQG